MRILGWPMANVCSTAKRGSLDRNCLLAASNLPLWPSALRQRREREEWVDVVRKENLRHAELSDPFFFLLLHQILFFDQTMFFSLSF